LESLPEFANSRLLGDLKLQEAKLDADLTKLSSRYGERHPEMIKRRGELEELRRSIGQEMDKIRGAIASELELAQTQVETLEQGVAEISGRRG
jgi:succinoglycan biosynthesis transport protein ExoP